MIRFIISFFLLFSTIVSFAQENSYNKYSNKSYISPSPTVGSLGMYGKTPASLYNGTLNVSVPIHTIGFKELQLAVNLQYVGGSGIKPNTLPNNAGLGFALTSGGVITRVVKGNADLGNYPTNIWDSRFYKWADGKFHPELNKEETMTVPIGTRLPDGLVEISRVTHNLRGAWGRGPITSKQWEVVTFSRASNSYSPLVGSYFSNPLDPDNLFVNWNSNTFSEEYLFRGFHRLSTYTKKSNFIDDTDPDEWLFNFNGYTGSFIMDYDGIFRVKSQNSPDFKVKFYYQRDVMIPLPLEEQVLPAPIEVGLPYVDTIYKQILLQAIELIDQDGVVYRFGGDENSIEFSRPGISIHNQEAINNIGGLIEPTGWFLTSITSPNGYSIDLEYIRDNFVLSKTEYSEAIESLGFSPNSRLTSSKNNVQGNRIEVVTLVNPVLLSRIKTPNEQIDFFYRPFNQLDYPENNSSNSNQDIFYHYIDVRHPKRMTRRMPKAIDYLHFYNNENNIYKRAFFSYDFGNQKRLKLQDLTIRDLYGKKSTFLFSYNEEELPVYLSGMEDIYGYYNGISPLLSERSENALNYFLTNSSLRTIREQEYLFSRRIVPAKVGAEILSKITYPTGGYTTFEYQTNEFSKSASTWPFIITANPNQESKPTGGLRIWRIKDYLANNEIVESRVFHYINDFLNGGIVSSGVSSFQPQFFEKFSGKIYDPAHPYYSESNRISSKNYNINYWRWNSNPILPLDNSRGSHISYSEVTEEIEGKGFLVHKFQNYDNGYNDVEPISYASDNSNLMNFNSYDEGISFELERGLLKEKLLFDINKNILTKEVFTYNDTSHRFNEYVKRIAFNVNPLDRDYITSMRATTSKIYTYHPYLKSHFTTMYTSSGILEEEVVFSFKQRKLVNQIKKQSDGSIKNSTFKYPFDFVSSPNDIFEKMLTRNMINLVHERHEKKSAIEEIETRFKYVNDDAIYPYEINKRIGAEGYYRNFSIMKYDIYGNPLEIKTLLGPIIVNIWGYNGQYLIAQIEYSDYLTVLNSIGGQEVLNELNSKNVKSTFIEKVFRDLRKNLIGSKVTNFTYEIPFGISSKTDPSGISEYFTYDGFGRVLSVTDSHGNVLKTYCYNFKGESINCIHDFPYSNTVISKDFYKTGCLTGFYGEKVTYSLPAGKYSGNSQFIADQLALNEIDENGQDYANQYGACKPNGIFIDFHVTKDPKTVDGYINYEELYVVLYRDEYKRFLLEDPYILSYQIHTDSGFAPGSYSQLVNNGFHSFGYFLTYNSMTSHSYNLKLSAGEYASGAKSYDEILLSLRNKFVLSLKANNILVPIYDNNHLIFYNRENSNLYLSFGNLDMVLTELEACNRLISYNSYPITSPEPILEDSFNELPVHGILFDLLSGDFYNVEPTLVPEIPNYSYPMFYHKDLGSSLVLLSDGYYIDYSNKLYYQIGNGKIVKIQSCY